MVAPRSPRHAAFKKPRRFPVTLCLVAPLLCVGLAPGASAADDAPYNLEKFRPVLDHAKLQAPTSSPTKINEGMFEGASNEYFHLDETGRYMVFTATGKSNRSELRQMTGDWQTSTAAEQRMTARLQVFKPDTPSLTQFTFLQIHDKEEDGNGLNKPLIRVVWYGDRKGTKDHLWAAIRTRDDESKPISNDNLGTKWVDLGARPTDFFDAVISVRDNQMRVMIDGETKLDMDVAYWDGLQNYFKAGVYNQDEGTSKVQFDRLSFDAARTPEASQHPGGSEPE